MENVLVTLAQLRASSIEEMKKQSLGIEFSGYAFPKNLDLEVFADYQKEVNQMLNTFNGLLTFHGAFYSLNPTAMDPMIREVVAHRMKQSIELAAQHNAKRVVFHALYIHSKRPGHKERWIHQQTNFWKNEILPFAKDHNMHICIENTTEPDASYIKSILEGIDSEHFSTCLDTGHTLSFGNSPYNAVEWAREYGDWLKHIHLNNNGGELDDHFEFTKGKQDFTGFFEHIKGLNEHPYIVIEVATKEAYQKSVEGLKEIYPS